MSIFCFKPVTASQKLSAQFLSTRVSRKHSLEWAAAKTKIPQKYLNALESGHYHLLPAATAYRRAYVKEYAAALGLDPGNALKQFVREGGLSDVSNRLPHAEIKSLPFASFSILIRNLSLGLATLLFVVYLGYQVRGVLEPPKLALFAPLEGDTSSEQSILVQGLTNPETHLTINGQEVFVSDIGRFETKIDASAGLNTITVSATKKHGKTTTITRHVVVRPKQLTATEPTPSSN